jgi:hypothetical protein
LRRAWPPAEDPPIRRQKTTPPFRRGDARGRLAQIVAALAFCAAIGAGCSLNDELNCPTAQRMHTLAHVYFDFIAANRNGPRDLDQLQAHLKTMEPFVLGTDDVESAAEELFVSDRDGEALVIRYGLDGGIVGQSLRVPIAYESLGLNGRRLVVFLDGSVKSLDETECDEQGVFE